ncbi:MAG: methyltransferase domain-containing protein [Dysgonomonas sp.]|nr:methyltransferase domain-containing protein [Dysgonomonas sp.]
MDKITEQKLARSLTTENTDLIPFLPYLLQDLWELGTPVKDILHLIGKHIVESSQLKILDLACGKGAVGISLAKEFGCQVKMIDIIPEFVNFAHQKAQELGVDSLCTFQIEDIQKSVISERGWDCVMLLAIGNVLGNIQETMIKLSSTISKNGYIIIEDSYISDDQKNNILCDYDYPSYDEWARAFDLAGLKIVEEMNESFDDIVSTNDLSNLHIAKRAQELSVKYPEKTDMFLEYVKSQLDESHDIENTVQSPIWLLQKVR